MAESLHEKLSVSGRSPLALAGLVAAHLVLGTIIAVVGITTSGPYWLFYVISAHGLEVFLVLVLSQTGLFGIWLGLSGSPFLRRLVATIFGLLYFATLVVAIVPPSVPLIGRLAYTALALIPLIGVALLMHFIRWRGAKLVLMADQPTDRPGLQFSIRQLLILTGVIALLFALKPEEVEANLLNSIVLLTAIGLGAMCVFVGSVWATLIPGPAAPRIVAVLGLTAFTGALPAYYVGMNMSDVSGMTAVAFVEAAIVIGSLLVIRTLGYRLVSDGQIDSRAASAAL